MVARCTNRSSRPRRSSSRAASSGSASRTSARHRRSGNLYQTHYLTTCFVGVVVAQFTIDAISVGESHSQPFRQASRTSATSLNARFAKRFCFRYNVLHSTLDCKAAEELCFRGSSLLLYQPAPSRTETHWRGQPRASFLLVRLRKSRRSRWSQATCGRLFLRAHSRDGIPANSALVLEPFARPCQALPHLYLENSHGPWASPEADAAKRDGSPASTRRVPGMLDAEVRLVLYVLNAPANQPVCFRAFLQRPSTGLRKLSVPISGGCSAPRDRCNDGPRRAVSVDPCSALSRHPGDCVPPA